MKKKPTKAKTGNDFSQRAVVIMLVLFIIVSIISLLVFLQVLDRTKAAGAASQRAASFSDDQLVSQSPSSGKVMLEIRERPENEPAFEMEEK